MHIYVNGRNIEITEAIKAYVKEKVGKVLIIMIKFKELKLYYQ